MVVIIFGENLVVWSGYVTGALFIFAFFGCSCNFRYFRDNNFMKWIGAKHSIFMRMALAFFLLHASLGILARFFGISI
jgi:hypothetical protein